MLRVGLSVELLDLRFAVVGEGVGAGAADGDVVAVAAVDGVVACAARTQSVPFPVVMVSGFAVATKKLGAV